MATILPQNVAQSVANLWRPNVLSGGDTRVDAPPAYGDGFGLFD